MAFSDCNNVEPEIKIKTETVWINECPATEIKTEYPVIKEEKKEEEDVMNETDMPSDEFISNDIKTDDLNKSCDVNNSDCNEPNVEIFHQIFGSSEETVSSSTDKKLKPFQCTVCGKSFVKNNLLIHHMRVHTKERPFACTVCAKSFTQSSTLTRHMLVHSKERRYQCTTCDKWFAYKSILNEHMQIHTGNRPFSCNVCNKSFIQNSKLVRHMRIHLGEKPYQCKECNKSFTQSNNLKDHMRIHLGNRPFTCTVCHKSFTQNRLARHMKTHSESTSD